MRHDSQIAADGGFGRMPDDENASYAPGSSDPQEESQFDRGASDDGFGDDFDDFEAGAEAEEFGDFDDGFGQPEPPKPEPFPFSKAVYVSNGTYQLAFHQSSSLCTKSLGYRAGTGPYADPACRPSLLCPLRLLLPSTTS